MKTAFRESIEDDLAEIKNASLLRRRAPFPNRAAGATLQVMRRALLLVNPASRRGREARTQAADLLREQDFDLIPATEENPANFNELIRRFADKIDLVIAGGGDGTISTLLPALRETRLPLGVLPLGTANNLARNLGVPLDLEEACRSLATSAIRMIDLGIVNGLPFLNVAGLGLSTEINRGVPAKLKRRWGVFGYALYGLKVVRRTRPFQAEISCAGHTAKLRALQITVCNGRHFGAGMKIHHDATITDARLDLCAFRLAHWWQGLFLLPAMRAGRQHEYPQVYFAQAPSITIRTRRKLWIDTDGEVLTATPAEFHIVPNALQVLAPPAPPVPP